MSYVVWFERIKSDMLPLVGGKGLHLGEMVQMRMPVPPGFVIVTDAFERFLDISNIRSEIKNLIEAGVRITNGIPARAEIKLDEKSVVWEKAENFSSPKYDLKDSAAELENGQAVVSGNISNPDNLTISKIIVSAFLVDKLGVKIGASKTELQNVGPFRVENFKVFMPVRKDLAGEVDLEATAQSVFVEILK